MSKLAKTQKHVTILAEKWIVDDRRNHNDAARARTEEMLKVVCERQNINYNDVVIARSEMLGSVS